MNPYLLRFIQADTGSQILFTVFAALMLAGFLWVFKKAGLRKAQIGFLVYLGIFSAVIQSHLILNHPMPWVPILMASVILGSVAFAFSKMGKMIATTQPLVILVGFQAFRFPLELILHHWAKQGTIPETMTWTGQNWDILTGLLSLASIPLFKNEKYARDVAWILNTIGFIFLVNVLRVVVMSSPFPFSWPLQVPLQLVFYLPYAWIAPLFVGAALMGHLITFRKLLSGSKN
ncbi:MAG: hypothetical protein JNL01_02165 [Bdellovibrionales bacterium]|nr:hypothetical protein [Bdellovibrionales bacterium]